MTQRLNYYQASPEAAKKFSAFSQTLHENPFLAKIGYLVTLRASQLNGCTFCVDMHVKEAKLAGERELRLHHVAVWRESPLFDAKEKAILEWTEALTQLPPHGIPNELFQRVRQQLSEQELADLSFLIVGINGWNRLGVAFQPVPGSSDQQFGLDKAGLA
ncbi:carboxymuconolactone decarboxylase family protein [Castellaniella sp.]|uniref:carboxymuconolactone decarboxylase family protein n=1 Tax=Castellaniella sp. TaxID=1955812 RepID=UPI002AFF0A7A|nr:carboxymuconolactone decarboxylase family protein [Castellaniella sp.]